MAFSHIQGAHNSSSAGATSITATFGISVTSGDCIVGVVLWGSTTNNLSGVTDSKGNTYTVLDTVTNVDGQSASSFCLGNITNGPISVTANFSASDSNLVLICDEYSGGLASSNPVDVHHGQSQSRPGTGTNAVSSGAATTTQNGDLIYGGAFDLSGASTTYTAGTGFALRTADTGLSRHGQSEDETQASAGSVAATFTSNQSGADYFTFMVAIKVAAAGGSTIVFRKTLSQIGGRAGSRQIQVS